MRLAAFLFTAGLCGLAAAAPPKAHRKYASELYPVDAVAPFVDAILADQEGNLGEAERFYEAANKISPQASTYFNLADLQQRMGRQKQAIESYKQYLVLAPDAKDRADVERLIDELERSEGIIVIDGDEPDALVIVDGRLIGPSPAITHQPKGNHNAFRITRTDFEHREFNANNASTTHVDFGHHSSKEKGGNLILVSNRSGVTGQWEDHGVKIQLGQRQTLPPGHYEGMPRSYVMCSPIIFDVPPGDDVTFVYVDMQLPIEQPNHMSCAPITVHAQKLKFP